MRDNRLKKKTLTQKPFPDQPWVEISAPGALTPPLRRRSYDSPRGEGHLKWKEACPAALPVAWLLGIGGHGSELEACTVSTDARGSSTRDSLRRLWGFRKHSVDGLTPAAEMMAHSELVNRTQAPHCYSPFLYPFRSSPC